jgi:quercetin dioxygenase-like cupin family protein
MDRALNVEAVETVSLTSSATDDAAWVGGYFAYGGSGSEQSVAIYFAIPPGKRLGRHYDTAEETQFFIGGSGELLLESGSQPVGKGDLIVLTEGTVHDLHNSGDEDLRVVGFFSKPEVEQHWSKEIWQPGDLKVTGTPNIS